MPVLTEEEKRAWNPFRKYLAPFIQEKLGFPEAVCPGIAQEIVNTITANGIRANQVRVLTRYTGSVFKKFVSFRSRPS